MIVCASLRAETAEEALAGMREARRLGADLCELRADLLRRPELDRILPARPLPVLVTARPRWEGGGFAGSEEERLGLLAEACRLGADYVDVEFRALRDFPRGNARVVVSWHDYEGVPADVESIATRMRETGAFAVKVACAARGAADLARLARLQAALGPAGIVVAMGEFGEPLRILGARWGCPLTYASLRAGSETAPGQVPLEELVRTFQARTIDARTEAYAVMGNPVAHSKSPILFNDVFKRLGMNARYVRLKADDAGQLRALVEALGLRGLSVTIPHKQAVVASLDEADEVVRGTGAANTVTARDGRLLGANTDVPAAMDALREAAVRKWSHGVYGMRALVLGAGGVARALAWGLKREGARVWIANRTFERGKALAEELGVEYARWENAAEVRPQVVVNGTSVGMAPADGESPAAPSLFRKDMVVLDTVYTPRRTKFLRDAREAGAEAVDGVDMFLRQADRQFRLWAGRPMPTEVLKEYARTL
jgi:3-dehydroquinate dehydratase/shikimate dehydrogenase